MRWNGEDVELLVATQPKGTPRARVYRFVDENGDIAYIGNTTNLHNRLKNHANYFKGDFKVEYIDVPYHARYRIESALIAKYRPYCNSFVAKWPDDIQGDSWQYYDKISFKTRRTK